jgi:putative Mg2+ transporter-C (MgtC) family protein
MEWPQQAYVFGDVALAMVLGGIIGAERQLAEKPAGLRTHMLVGGASALMVTLADLVLTHFHGRTDTDLFRADALRLLSAIITGVSFLGAGTILRVEHGVQGLTTAASMLFTAGIGMCTALHERLLAGALAILVLIVLRVLHPLELRWPHGGQASRRPPDS